MDKRVRDLDDTLDESELAKTIETRARKPVREAQKLPAPAPSAVPPAPSDPGARLPGTAPNHIGRYVVLRPLGEGGMGVVYAAYDEELDRKVALKLIHPSLQGQNEIRTRILREAQALARVSAPNVVTVYEAGEALGQIFIAMEFVNGTTLTKWSETKRSWQEILRMYLDAGQGLLAAHQAGLVHRDFKPDNVLIGKDGRPRVADFGLARIDEKAEGSASPLSAAVPTVSPVSPASTGSTARRSQEALPLLSPVTQAGAVLGTPLYMSPEQHLGEPTDARSDQFSFCVALYEALYGQLPFAGDTVQSLGFNTISGRIQPRPAGSQVPKPVHLALLRGLSPSPDQRFPSMAELLAALSYDPDVDPTAGPRARRRVALSLIAFMLIALWGMRGLLLLDVSPFRASLATAFAYFGTFVFVAVRFRHALKNPFHRGCILYGLVFGGQVLAIRVVGLLLGLTHVQAVTLDLVALAAMTCVIAPLVLPGLWPVAPLAAGSALVAVALPEYAETLSSWVVALSTFASLYLWNQALDQRGSHRRARAAGARGGGSFSTGSIERISGNRSTPAD